MTVPAPSEPDPVHCTSPLLFCNQVQGEKMGQVWGSIEGINDNGSEGNKNDQGNSGGSGRGEEGWKVLEGQGPTKRIQRANLRVCLVGEGILSPVAPDRLK